MSTRQKYLTGLLVFFLAGSLWGYSATGYTAPVTPAPATIEPYVVGYLTDMTGPTRYLHAPELEGCRAYIEELNGKGGIKGHPVKLVVQDHKNDPTRAAALAKKLIVEDKVLALLGTGMSPNQPPINEEAKKAGVPQIHGMSTGLVTYPPNPEKLVFTTNWLFHAKIATGHISQALMAKMLGFGEGTRVAIFGYDTPSGRGGDYQLEKWSKLLGHQVVYRGNAPPGTLALTPWAIKIAEAKPDIYYHTHGLSEIISLIPALEKLGFNGTLIIGMTMLESEFAKAAALSRGMIKNIYVGSRMVLRYRGVEKEIPEYGKMVEAVKKSGQEFPVGHHHVVGWIMGTIVEKALSKVGWPATPAALLNALETLEVDTRGLTGGPIRYSPTDHHGPSWRRVYRWDLKTNEPVVVTDWWEFKLEQYLEK